MLRLCQEAKSTPLQQISITECYSNVLNFTADSVINHPARYCVVLISIPDQRHDPENRETDDPENTAHSHFRVNKRFLKTLSLACDSESVEATFHQLFTLLKQLEAELISAGKQ